MDTARLLLFICIIPMFLFCACGGHRHAAPISPQTQPAVESVDDALAQLDALPCPTGVDSELWTELKGALEEALACRAGTSAPPSSLPASSSGGGPRVAALQKIVSAPPAGEANQISDLAVADNGDRTFTLRWHYRNLGDYDQNGTVGISDITPLAQHFGETYDPEAEPDCIQAVIDGSGNGAVDIADIKALAVNLGASCSAYCVLGGLDLEEPFQFVLEAPLQEAAGDGRREFSVVLENVSRFYYSVYPLDAVGKPGAPSEPVALPGGAPVIEDVVRTGNYAGEEVTFAAIVSGGVAVEYTWDFGGLAEPNTSTEAEPTVTLVAGSWQTASAKVSNPLGESTYDFYLNPDETLTVLAVYPTSGMYGEPVEFFAEVVGGEALNYYWEFGDCAERSTSHAFTPTVFLGFAGTYECRVTVENTWDVAVFPFTFVVGSEPAAVGPPVVKAVQAQGVTNETTQVHATVQGTPPFTYAWKLGGASTPGTCCGISPTVLLGATGEYPATLTVTNGEGEDTFAFTLSVLPIPTVTVDGRVFQWGSWEEGVSEISVEVVDSGLPLAITDSEGYYEIPGVQIGQHTVRPLPESGRVFEPWSETITVSETSHTAYFHTVKTDWHVRTIHSGLSGYGYDSSLAVVNGRPAVSYQVDGAQLMFRQADDADGLSWSASPVSVATGVGACNTLAVVAGRPVIACAGAPNYYRALDSTGVRWGPAVQVAQAATSSLVSLQVVGWRPALLYYDEASEEIKYVRTLDASGSAWGNSVSVFGGDIDRCARFGFSVINGMPAVTYPDASSWPEKLIYQRALDVNGQTWSPPVVVGSQWGIGGASSIVCVEGNPAIAYDVPNGICSANIAYVRAADSLGSAWGEPVVVYVGQDGAIGYPSEAIAVNGRPAVFYWEGNEVLFVESNDAVGSSWSEPQLVDREYAVFGPSATVVNGHPAVSYYVKGDGIAELRYAVYMPE